MRRIGFLIVAGVILNICDIHNAMSSNQTGLILWESLGLYGGDQFDLKISPVDNQTLFVHGHYGIHRSVNGGATWSSISIPEMIHGNTILDLEFDPLNSNTIFLCGSLRGIWKSQDNGNTWELCSSGIPQRSVYSYVSVTSIAIDSRGILYAGISEPREELVPAPVLIYRSEDEGEKWVEGDQGILVLSETLYQDVKVLLSKDAEGSLWAMVYGGGVFRLEEGDWISRVGDLPESGLRATYLAHHPTQPGHLFLGTEDDWIYESTDYGISWSSMAIPQELQGLNILPLVYYVGLDPNNPDLVFIRTNDSYGSIEQPLFKPRPEQNEGGGFFFSLDAGSQWDRQSRGVFRMTFDPTEIIFDNIPNYDPVERSKTSYLTAGGIASVSKSMNGHVSFEPITTGIESILMNTVWVHPDPPPGYETIVYGGAESGIHIGEGGYLFNWKRQRSVENHLYTWSFALDFSDPSRVYYSTGNPAWNFLDERGIYRTSLDCLAQPEETVCSPGEQLLADVGVWKVITTPDDPMKIYAACQEDGVMLSLDGGQTWNGLNNGLTLPVSITDLVVDHKGEPLFASSRLSNGNISNENMQHWIPSWGESGAIYAFEKEEEKWTRIDDVEVAVMGLDFDEVNNILYAATVQGIGYSEDGGMTWHLYESGYIFRDVLIDPTREGVIYAGSNLGVHRSMDGGLNWHRINNGLRTFEVNKLAVDINNGALYAATSGGSIQRLLPDHYLPPYMYLDIGELRFESTQQGFSVEAFFSIGNTGDADLEIRDIYSSNAVFTVVDSFPETISPEEVRDITVSFMPREVGEFNGILTIISNDIDHPTFELPVAGQGINPVFLGPDMQ